MSWHADFPRVTLLRVVKKYLLRPEHFIIGLKTTGRGGNTLPGARNTKVSYGGPRCRQKHHATQDGPEPSEVSGSAARRGRGHVMHIAVDGPGVPIEPDDYLFRSIS